MQAVWRKVVEMPSVLKADGSFGEEK